MDWVNAHEAAEGWGNCVAMTVRGRRCGRTAQELLTVTFKWDPVRGVGVGGPDLPLCRMHGIGEMRGSDRFEVVGGWVGAAWNPEARVWTVLTTVYETRGGFGASRHWWAKRRPTKFGVCERVVYDDAISA